MPFPDLKSRRATPADNTHQTHSAQTAPDTEAIWGEAAFSADAASRPKMTRTGNPTLRITFRRLVRVKPSVSRVVSQFEFSFLYEPRGPPFGKVASTIS